MKCHTPWDWDDSDMAFVWKRGCGKSIKIVKPGVASLGGTQVPTPYDLYVTDRRISRAQGMELRAG